MQFTTASAGIFFLLVVCFLMTLSTAQGFTLSAPGNNFKIQSESQPQQSQEQQQQPQTHVINLQIPVPTTSAPQQQATSDSSAAASSTTSDATSQNGQYQVITVPSKPITIKIPPFQIPGTNTCRPKPKPSKKSQTIVVELHHKKRQPKPKKVVLVMEKQKKCKKPKKKLVIEIQKKPRRHTLKCSRSETRSLMRKLRAIFSARKCHGRRFRATRHLRSLHLRRLWDLLRRRRPLRCRNRARPRLGRSGKRLLKCLFKRESRMCLKIKISPKCKKPKKKKVVVPRPKKIIITINKKIVPKKKKKKLSETTIKKLKLLADCNSKKVVVQSEKVSSSKKKKKIVITIKKKKGSPKKKIFITIKKNKQDSNKIEVEPIPKKKSVKKQEQAPKKKSVKKTPKKQLPKEPATIDEIFQ